MTIHSNIATQIQDAQLEALMKENVANKSLRGMHKQFELDDNRMRYFMK